MNTDTKHAVRAIKPWVARLARLGYLTKGALYIVIGFLAIGAATASGGKTADANAAITFISHQPFGRVLVGCVALGLAGYVMWRLIQAFIDPEHEGTQLKGWLTRIGYCLSAAVYGTLCIGAIKLLRGTAEANSPVQHLAAQGLRLPFGNEVVMVAGSAVAALGIYSVIFGITADFCKHLDTHAMGKNQARLLPWLGRFGYSARGVVFLIIGLYLTEAGFHHNPDTARGIDGAQVVVGEWSKWALYVIAAGLLSFGSFMLVEAKYNRIDLTQ